ncbi:phage tail tape measure protein [Palleronia sp. KMU-117]|uniref:phage tail tape measure protein n=1 Tax=Palleronia sp. KMU-117 TaxID=3434108 RepID=UPI003D762C6C
MDEIDGLTALDEQIVALEQSLGGAQTVAAAFDGQVRRMSLAMTDAGGDVGRLSTGISRSLRQSFDGLILDGKKLSDVLGGLARSMVETAYSAAMRPVTDSLGGLVASGIEGLVGGMLPFARGASFTQGRVMPFAQGGIVSGPVAFPMRGGTGLMGEAGPEAIMPLTRGADGRLGVRSDGGGRAVQVVMNISTPDVEGFRRSQSRVASQLGRALGRGQRNR